MSTSMGSRRDLIVLAEAVADGQAVDWDEAESDAATQEELSAIHQLRALAGVGAAARACAQSWGPLEIRAEIGGGTFGTVYRAWDPRLEREVALKLLHPHSSRTDASWSVVSEARLLARIRHVNVVTVYGADSYDERVGIWMELLCGRTLKEILEDSGPFGAHEAAIVGRDLCRALAVVHQQGFLHCDIKAQNVIRETGGRTVLMDFGAGRASREIDDGARVAGTPVYLAPEVLAGSLPTPRSDIYSLGVLLFHLVSGSFPISSGSLEELRTCHARNSRKSLRDLRPGLPDEFIQVIERATAADPDERPQTPGAMEALLQAALALPGKQPTRSGDPTAVPHQRARGAYRYAGVALGVAALAGATWAYRAGRPVRPTSIAVVPFRTLTPQRANDFFSMGIADDIASNLSRIGELRVVSASDKATHEKSASELAADLQVDVVLDGSVRWAEGGRVRVVSRLVDGRSGETLWSETFDRRIGEADTSSLSIQAEVSRKIAVILKSELSEATARELAASGPLDAARSHYLAGRYHWSLRTEDGFSRSIEAYQRALKLAPAYAPAYAGLADSYTLQGTLDLVPRATAYAAARAAAQKAVELDGSSAEARASLGYVQKNEFQWRAAEESLRQAIALRPAFATAHHWYGILLTQQGRFPEAIVEIKAAMALDPTAIAPRGQLAATLELARRYGEAIEQAERVIEIDPLHPIPYLVLAEAHAYKGDYPGALAAMDRRSKAGFIGAGDQIAQANLGFIHAMAGHRQQAGAIVRSLEAREAMGEPVAAAIATIHGALGNHDRAVEFLGRSLARGESELGYLKVDPRWDPLRGDPRFREFVKRVGLTE